MNAHGAGSIRPGYGHRHGHGHGLSLIHFILAAPASRCRTALDPRGGVEIDPIPPVPAPVPVPVPDPIRHASFCMPRGPRTESGHALLTTMIAVACLVPLGAFAAMQARLDLLVQQHTRTALETFAVAESGLEHALADLAADARWERLLAGPDRQPGTPDDAEYPFMQPPPEFFPHDPFRYEVRIAALTPDLLEIDARGFGPAGATRVVVASVHRASVPYVPAAVSLAARAPAVALGDSFRIAGLVARPDDPGVPALAVDGADTAAALADSLEPAADQLVGRGGVPSIAGMVLPSVDSLAELAAQRADATELSGEVRGALGDGLFVAPSLRMIDVTGSGVLVVDGPLEIGGTTTFAGLIIAAGDVRMDSSAELAIDGGVMVGSAGTVLALRGAGYIAYDRRIIERIDAAFPGLLPRRARVTGWRERPDAAL